MDIVYSERHRLHDTSAVRIALDEPAGERYPLGSYEVPARAEEILDAVRSAGLGPVLPPEEYGLAPLLAVHDADYLSYLQQVYDHSAAAYHEAAPVMVWTFAGRHAQRKPKGLLARKGYYAFGWGTPILEGTWEAAYWSAQCAVTAAARVRDGQAAAYALCRPPGHHAGPDLYGGYCYLNNAAIAARYLQQKDFGSLPGLPKSGLPKPAPVAILDVDYHHGNGTQLVFYSDPSVLYASLHADPDESYPFYWGGAGERGAGPGEGTNRNWPLPRGTGDDRYLETLDEALAAIRAFAPAYLLVSVGFDTVEGDPEGGFCLSHDGVRRVGEAIAVLRLPTVIVQEGGYSLGSLGQHAVAFLQAFT